MKLNMFVGLVFFLSFAISSVSVTWNPDLSILKIDPKNWTDTMRTSAMYAGGIAAVGYAVNLPLTMIVISTLIAYGITGAGTILYVGLAGMIWGYRTKDKLVLLVCSWVSYCSLKGWSPTTINARIGPKHGL